MVNACHDDTLPHIQQFAEQNKGGLPLRWMEESTPGKSYALNSAMPLLESDLVAFVDDDHRVDPNYIVSICAAAVNFPEFELFCGRILPDWDGSEPEWVHDAGPYRVYPLPVPRFDQGMMPRSLTPDIAIPGGGNLILRRELFDRVGDFSTSLGPTGHNLEGSEDIDWVMRAQRLGARLQYVPSVVQYHYVDLNRFTLSYMMKKAYKRTASTTGLQNGERGTGVPRHIYRKLGEYILLALASLNKARRRFYLVRSAAAFGEMSAYRKKQSALQVTNSQSKQA